LFFQVTQNNTFDGNRGRRDRASAQYTRQESKDEATKPAQEVAAATAPPSPFKLSSENCTVSLLVSQELRELVYKIGSRQASHKDLPRVYVDRTVFSGVVHLENAPAQISDG
jgi:hypothetical protein